MSVIVDNGVAVSHGTLYVVVVATVVMLWCLKVHEDGKHNM